MKQVIMTTEKSKTDKREKRVTFENQDDLKGSEHDVDDVSEGGVCMQVKGHGLLMIRSSSLDENDESVVDIFVNVRNPSSPVTLILPKERNGAPDVFGDGDIQFTMKGTDEIFHMKDFNNIEPDNDMSNDLDDVKESKGNGKYTHRRINSDFLQIFGTGEFNGSENGEQSIEDNNKVSVERDTKINDQQRRGEENSFNFPSLEGKFTSIYSEINDTVDSSMAKLNQLSKETRQYGGGNNNNITHEQEQVDTCTDSDSEKENNELNAGAFSKRNDSLPIYRRKRNRQKFRKSVKSANKEIWRDDKSLKSAIQHSYTYLLDVLDALELCDHLYESGLLDINMYQKIFELCFEQHQVIYAKRYLLMYLSTRTICHDKFVDALYGSAQYQLVPLFYPGVVI